VIAVGTQGWNYDAWVGPFYPRGSRADAYLELYAKMFPVVEVDATFYATPSESAVRGWDERTPAGFSFTLKLPRVVTHERRLRDSREEVERFCERARLLGTKLASVLVQLPPDFTLQERPALEAFLPELPAGVQFAVEFRDRSWYVDDTLELLERFGVAFALVDGEWAPRALVLELGRRPTADYVYARWMGSREITDHSRVQIARDEELALWAALLRELDGIVERVDALFSNFFQGHAPASASTLMALLGQTPPDPESLVTQPSLF
jgi:uncharacterized protein YecE (DUF72 family)